MLELGENSGRRWGHESDKNKFPCPMTIGFHADNFHKKNLNMKGRYGVTREEALKLMSALPLCPLIWTRIFSK